MAKFTVRRYQDAYVIQEAEVEANDAKDAAQKAYNDDDLAWGPADTQTFDATGIVTLNDNGEEIEETRTGKLFG